MSNHEPKARAGDKWIVVTTINRPTEAIDAIAKLAESGWRAVVVGDNKTPSDWAAPGVDFLSVQAQRARFGGLADLLHYNHYCRKNLGYLYAAMHGAEWILETDDDNIPYPEFGENIAREIPARIVGGAEWINVYKYFTDAQIWPRGLPLDEIASIGAVRDRVNLEDFPIQQYLADLDPDVDAIYRLIFNGETTFAQSESVALEAGSWAPFNSQNTLFERSTFALMYLPCNVSFRMTDIWRSFVAQMALWKAGKRLVFRSSTVKQVRNAHNLMRDFADEIPGYIENKRIGRLLTSAAAGISSTLDMTDVAIILWRSLIEGGVIPETELPILEGWMTALKSCTRKR